MYRLLDAKYGRDDALEDFLDTFHSEIVPDHLTDNKYYARAIVSRGTIERKRKEPLDAQCL